MAVGWGGGSGNRWEAERTQAQNNFDAWRLALKDKMTKLNSFQNTYGTGTKETNPNYNANWEEGLVDEMIRSTNAGGVLNPFFLQRLKKQAGLYELQRTANALRGGTVSVGSSPTNNAGTMEMLAGTIANAVAGRGASGGAEGYENVDRNLMPGEGLWSGSAWKDVFDEIAKLYATAQDVVSSNTAAFPSRSDSKYAKDSGGNLTPAAETLYNTDVQAWYTAQNMAWSNRTGAVGGTGAGSTFQYFTPQDIDARAALNTLLGAMHQQTINQYSPITARVLQPEMAGAYERWYKYGNGGSWLDLLKQLGVGVSPSPVHPQAGLVGAYGSNLAEQFYR